MFLSVATLAALAATTCAQSLTPVSNFGANPGGLSMNVYAPSGLKAKGSVILVLHGCGSNAKQGLSMTGFDKFAAQKNFVLVVPQTTKDMRCWDNHSAKSLRHEGGGDTQSLANMVKYAISKYNTDPKKTFVTGFSSGGMMTNTMTAVYPDLFAAAVPQAGVPAGCMAGRGTSAPGFTASKEQCARGNLSKTGPQYVSAVKAMYPGYTGLYPRVQVWHGARDSLVYPVQFSDELRQWSSVHGVSFARNVTGTPAGYTRSVYGDGSMVEGYLYSSGGHSPMYKGNEAIIFKFLGI